MPATTLPTIQSAWLQVARGSYKADGVLKLDDQYPVPTPAEGEVVVKVKFCALNPVGHKTMAIPFMRKLPNVVEYDLAGVVASSRSADFAEGDEVFGIIPANDNMKLGHGAMAQYALVQAANLAKKPSSLSFEKAACLPLVGLTAHGGLLAQGGLKSGQKVFINGGATSVGRIAIGIAKKVGATVVVSCSSKSADTCKSLGADELVDYEKVALPAYLAEHHAAAPFDLILDLVGDQAALFSQSAAYLAPTGKLILIGGSPPKGLVGKAAWAAKLGAAVGLPAFLGGTPRKFQFWLLDDTKGLKELGDWAADGTVQLDVDSVQAFDRAGVLAAFDRVASEQATGKVLVEVPQ